MMAFLLDEKRDAKHPGFFYEPVQTSLLTGPPG